MALALSSAQVFEAELTLPLKPSRLLLTFTLLIQALVLISVCLMPLTWLWKLGLILSIALLSFYEWHSQPSLGASNFKTLIWRETGGWELELAQGKRQAVKLTQHFSTNLLTILHLQLHNQTTVVVLLSDNLDAANRQILKRRLKLMV